MKPRPIPGDGLAPEDDFFYQKLCHPDCHQNLERRKGASKDRKRSTEKGGRNGDWPKQFTKSKPCKKEKE
jgi:hypothetical protein